MYVLYIQLNIHTHIYYCFKIHERKCMCALGKSFLAIYLNVYILVGRAVIRDSQKSRCLDLKYIILTAIKVSSENVVKQVTNRRPTKIAVEKRYNKLYLCARLINNNQKWM